MSGRSSVFSPAAPAPIGPYEQAVRAGDFLFCSGQIPLDPMTGDLVSGDITAETERVLDNLAAVLAAAGSSLAAIVKTTIFLTNMADFAAVNEAYAARFGEGASPARSTVGVAALPRGVRVEIEAVAYLG